MTSGDNEYMTPGEVAKMFRVDPKTVTRWAQDKRIPTAFRTLGGTRRYSRAAMIAYRDRGRVDVDPDSGT